MGVVTLTTDALQISSVIDTGGNSALFDFNHLQVGQNIQLGTEVGGKLSLTDSELDRVPQVHVQWEIPLLEHLVLAESSPAQAQHFH